MMETSKLADEAIILQTLYRNLQIMRLEGFELDEAGRSPPHILVTKYKGP